MEKLGSVIVSSYLFPATPFNKSLWEEVLSSQLVSKSGKDSGEAPALAKLRNVWKVTYDVERALSSADLTMAERKGGSFYGFPSEIQLRFLLNVSNEPFRRNDGQSVVDYNDIMGKKYVMACILSVPDSCISRAWDVANISAELYAQRKDDFECIIFLRQRLCGWENFASFEDFHKLFDKSCIIIHLDDFYSAIYEHNELFVIDPNGKLLLDCPLSVISQVGSAAFPFEKADVISLNKERCHLNHSSLETLLGVEPSHKFFRKIPGTDPLQEDWRCISEFRSKIVFLFIYCYGNRLALLYDTLKGLREKGMEFEIITAYVPACEDRFPSQFLEVFSSLVAKLGLSWWVVPYNSSTYPRLMPLYAYHAHSDRMIVFDPKLDDGDPHGLEVLKYITYIDQSMFPFTKMSVAEHVEEELKQVSLKSLFERVTHLCKEDPEYNVCETKSVLEGKDVLVYFDTAVNSSTALDQFVSWYNSLGEKEKRRNNFEVVCVYLDLNALKQDEYNIESRRQFSKWLICSDDEEKACAKYVADNFFLKLFKRKLSTVVAFGKDGKIGSLCAHCLLSSSSSSGAVTFPLKGDLREEIFNIFNDYCTKLCSRNY